MKRNVWNRCVLGAFLGLGITTGIAIAISLIIGDGTYYAVMPQLVQDFGSELNAVLVQTMVSLMYGAIWGGASFVWEMENWSITRQTVTHLLIVSLSTLPVAYLMRWMDRNVLGILGYFGIFLMIYGVVWIFLYLGTKRRVEKLNQGVQRRWNSAE